METVAKKIRSWEEERVRDWILENRGILTQIAVKNHVCHQFVQMIAYGKGTTNAGHVVEGDLRNAGWPGIRRRK
jgi:hypothetical protein